MTVLGLFALTVALIIIMFASMFTTEVSPLVATLQSPFLWIHVTTVSLSQGVLAVSFIAGLIYLVKKIDQTKLNMSNFSLEIVLFSLLAFVGYIISVTTFNIMDYKVEFELQPESTIAYEMPAIFGPNEGEIRTEAAISHGVKGRGCMLGKDDARNLNTVTWAL